MTVAGKLCHRLDDEEQGAGCLCHRSDLAEEDPGALVRKASADRKTPMGSLEITCTFEPLDWVCDTYNATHQGALDIETDWDGSKVGEVGAFTMYVDDNYTGGTTELSFTVTPQDLCAAHEYPETITGAISVTKGDVTKTVAPFEWHPNSDHLPRLVTITLEDGELTGVEVTIVEEDEE